MKNPTTGRLDTFETMKIPPVSSDYDPHLEFRTLSMLFTTVSTINRGQPSQPSRPYDEKYYTKKERSSRRERALNAVATILVRNTEVVAVVDHGPSQHEPYQSMLCRTESGRIRRRMGSNHLFWDPKSVPSQIQIGRSQIRGFRTLQNFSKSKKKPLYVIAKPGESHYCLISESHWNCLKIK